MRRVFMPEAGRQSVAGRIASHFPAGQFTRYLLIGGVNTVFGYGLFAGLTRVLDARLAHGYILAGVVSTLLNISFSFLSYKLFVFKTKGNYLREWARCVVVYSGAIALNAAALPVLVFALRHWTSMTAGAPYVAGGLLMGTNVIFSFLGHRNFSFRARKESKSAVEA